jgi:hypothetical protein
MASTVGRVQDLVVEDREVQRKAQTDGVGRCELGLSDVGGRLYDSQLFVDLPVRGVIASYLVGLVCSGRGDLALLTGGELGKVTVVVSLPGSLLAVDTLRAAVCTHILW